MDSHNAVGRTELVAPPTGPYMSSAEFAQYARLAERTPSVWRGRNIGPPWIKCGRRVLYRRDDVDAWLRARLVSPVEPIRFAD